MLSRVRLSGSGQVESRFFNWAITILKMLSIPFNFDFGLEKGNWKGLKRLEGGVK